MKRDVNVSVLAKTIDGMSRGSYVVAAASHRQYNEVRVALYEMPFRTQLASSFISAGKKPSENDLACLDLLGTTYRYLRFADMDAFRQIVLRRRTQALLVGQFDVDTALRIACQELNPLFFELERSM